MADNYLEKRYREVFGSGSSTDPETGYSSVSVKKKKIVLKKVRKPSGPEHSGNL